MIPYLAEPAGTIRVGGAVPARSRGGAFARSWCDGSKSVEPEQNGENPTSTRWIQCRVRGAFIAQDRERIRDVFGRDQIRNRLPVGPVTRFFPRSPPR